jgi:acetyltransferase-like isoleucine patch superfamily enzyme
MLRRIAIQLNKLSMAVYWRRLSYGKGTFVSPWCRIVGPDNILLGNKVAIFAHSVLNCDSTGNRVPFARKNLVGQIVIGDGTKISSYAMLQTYGGRIRIGKNCSVNPFTILYGHGGIEIADNVRIAAHVTIVASNHNFESADTPIFTQGIIAKGIVIRDDVWIGTGARILDGVVIGKGVVVAAGAVVNCDIPDYTVVGGIPARPIGQRTRANQIRLEAK